jgi:hypothetical protein
LGGGGGGGGGRNSAAAAFPTTVKAKRLGFFKRKRKGVDEQPRSFGGSRAAGDPVVVVDLPGKKDGSGSGWMSGRKIKKNKKDEGGASAATGGGSGGGCAVM